MKTLKQLLEKAPPKGYEPKPKDEKRFVDKHVVAKTADANGNKDDVFKATNVKAVDRNQEGHGYNPGDDEAVYEQADITEKTLTSAEKSKREQVAQAIERDNPGMGKSKKMAIATATAKRVAEEAEPLDEEEYDRIRDLYGKSAARSMAYSRWSKHHPSYGKTSSQTKPASSSSDSSKIYHKVPFAQKDDAKKEGMRWDSGAKKWYHSSAAASSSSKFRKEEAEHDEENQIVEFINSFYEQLDADNQKIFEELASEQDIPQILEMIEEVLSGEENG